MNAKIKHYVCPLRSGKTTKAQELQNNNPEETILIEADELTDLTLIFTKYIKKFKYKTVIIDNFLTLYCNKNNNVKNFIRSLKLSNVENIILFSTPDKIYDKKLDKKEMQEKFIEGRGVDVICGTFYNGLSSFDRMNLTQILPHEQFQTKILGDLYGTAKV